MEHWLAALPWAWLARAPPSLPRKFCQWRNPRARRFPRTRISRKQEGYGLGLTCRDQEIESDSHIVLASRQLTSRGWQRDWSRRAVVDALKAATWSAPCP